MANEVNQFTFFKEQFILTNFFSHLHYGIIITLKLQIFILSTS